MKALVLEVEGKHAVVLNKEGEFIRIKNDGTFRVGYEIDVPIQTAGVSILTRIGQIAAVVVIMLGLSSGAYCYSTPYSYVSLDINPSIEIQANIFDRIINVEGLNDEAKI